MASVYIVTAGSYSEYHIVAVFSSEDLAQRFIDATGYGDSIEEYEVDADKPSLRKGLRVYDVTMLRDGRSSVSFGGDIKEAEKGRTDFSYAFGWGDWRPDMKERLLIFYLSCVVYAEDEQHAVKIANERRVQLIASGEWEREFERVKTGRAFHGYSLLAELPAGAYRG